MTRRPKVRACKECGCTDDNACEFGCWWIGPNLCSSCGPATLNQRSMKRLTATRVKRRRR